MSAYYGSDETKVDSGLLVRKENSSVYPPGKFGGSPAPRPEDCAPACEALPMGVGCYVFCAHAGKETCTGKRRK